MNNRTALLDEIRALEFALIETNLFLDGNPDPDAITYFENTRRTLAAKKQEYETTVGPLVAENGVMNGRWAWTDGPWPWECEAN